MSKRTPGVWYQHQNTVQGGTSLVATLYGGSEEINANAALIAAAPELYAALRTVEYELMAVIRENWPAGTEDILGAILTARDAAVAALAKAEGK